MLQLWNDACTGVRVVRLTEDEQIDALVRSFEQVAAERGWQPDGALSLYRDRSVYFGLLVRGQLAGGLQLVMPDTAGSLACQSVWPEVEITPANRSAHVAVMALNRDYRAHGDLFWQVVIEMWRYSVGKGIDKLYIECSPRVLKLYRRLGWPLQVEGELRRHWGGDTLLCTLTVAEVAAAILQKRGQSRYYQQIVDQMLRLSVATEWSATDKAVVSQAACA